MNKNKKKRLQINVPDLEFDVVGIDRPATKMRVLECENGENIDRNFVLIEVA